MLFFTLSWQSNNKKAYPKRTIQIISFYLIKLLRSNDKINLSISKIFFLDRFANHDILIV